VSDDPRWVALVQELKPHIARICYRHAPHSPEVREDLAGEAWCMVVEEVNANSDLLYASIGFWYRDLRRTINTVYNSIWRGWRTEKKVRRAEIILGSKHDY
jgi:hypothetical protein